jgi:acetyltransferase
LEDILIRLGRLVTDFPEIEELDINPMLVRKGEIMGVDARVLIKKTTIVSPAHLIISPYPAWQEMSCRTTDNDPFLIRPIRPDDANQMIDFFSGLSPETIYLRYFSPIKQLSKQMLIKFTQVDYDREVALVAIVNSKGDQKIVGVARVIFLPDGETGEFAIVLADHWQGKGIGAAMLMPCLRFSKQQGLKRVMGLVLSENIQMTKLGKRLGFRMKRDPDSYDIELEIDLDKIDFSAEMYN